MKFVALLSGGKDSCFNVLHCLSNGHELIALANLYPEAADSDEIDSYMYQTVGYNVLQQYEECIGLPMYRQPIKGKPRNLELDYEKTLDDETEDLYTLLSHCLSKHPDLEAVSVGAILLSYQRTRVEHVCSRLGLVSLAYLWQRDQDQLMQEMCSSAMDARILKVAAYGLDLSHLGMLLPQIYPSLVRLNQQFQVHICGEGGEFETMVLDAPFFLRRKLVLTSLSVVTHSSGDVFYLKMEVDTEDKEPQLWSTIDWKSTVTQQPLLTGFSKEICEELESLEPDLSENLESLNIATNQVLDSVLPQTSYASQKSKFYYSNLSSSKSLVEDQTHDILLQLKTLLASDSLDCSSVITTTLLVRSMSNFAKINEIYSSFFQGPIPPSRTCIETCLPEGVHLQLSCVAIPKERKKGLHVQGRSYWAPANIGPYSQAVYDTSDGFAELAGQIPLVPASMDLLSPDQYALNTSLSLKHINSVKDAISHDRVGAYIAYVKTDSYVQYAAKAFKHYDQLRHDEDFVEPAHKSLIIVKVRDLPRGAMIEWSGKSYQNMDHIEEKLAFESYEVSGNGGFSTNGLSFIQTMCFDSLQELQKVLTKDVHFTVYGALEDLSALTGYASAELVPVDQVYNYRGDKVKLGVLVRG